MFRKSHLPETKVLLSGESAKLMASPAWPLNVVVCWPVSISHWAQVMSPLEVRICVSSRKRQQDRYPVCPGNSRLTCNVWGSGYNFYKVRNLYNFHSKFLPAYLLQASFTIGPMYSIHHSGFLISRKFHRTTIAFN